MGIFSSDKTYTTSSTSNYNDSRVQTENNSNSVSNNTTTNTSSNSSVDWNNTLTQDRRLVNDHGLGISADNSTISTSNSNNTTNWTVDASNKSMNDNSVSSNFWQQITNDNHSTTVTDLGSVAGGLSLSQAALGSSEGIFNTAANVLKTMIGSNENVSLHQLDAGNYLAKQGYDMLRANIDYSQHLSDSNAVLQSNAIAQIKSASENAISQVTAIAAKPLNAQDPQHIIVIVGLVVVGVMALKGFK